MSAKRIRCECGRIYEPAKHSVCPACGAPPLVATIEPPKSDEKPLVRQKDVATDVTQEDAKPIAISGRTLAIIGGGTVALILIVLLLVRRGGKDDHDKGNASVTPPPSATASVAAITPAPTQVYSPPSVVTPPPGGAVIIPPTFDLPGAIANAPSGATIKVPPGYYSGGIVVSRPIRIVGNNGQVFIQANGRESLSVRSNGVAVEGVQFFCEGIGELPAISIADGAELEMDGCKVQSSTALGVSVNGNASLRAIGSAFTAGNGTAVKFNQQARGNFTQCTFNDTRYGVMALAGANVELHSCAFERSGGSDSQGALLAVSGANTNVSADDCHFTGNYAGISVDDHATLSVTNSPFSDNGPSSGRGIGSSALLFVRTARAVFNGNTLERNHQGVVVIDRGTIEMEKCTFSQNGLRQTQGVTLGTLPLTVGGEGSVATVRNTVFADSLPYAMAVLAGAKLTIEESEISGTQYVGIFVGDRNGPSLPVVVKHSRFLRNGTGLVVFGGSSASVQDSEVRENKDGLVAYDPNSHLEVKKTGVFGSREHGLHVYNGADLRVADCELRDNARGAQSGLPHKASAHALLALEDCRFGGNRIFATGACAKSELMLARCAFDGTDKENISRERSSIVQTDTPPTPSASPALSPSEEASPSPNESPIPSASPGRRPRPTPRPRVHRPEDDAARILRHIFRPR